MDMRRISIMPALNGYVVEVGCQVLVYNDIECLAGDLIAYARNPLEVEKNFLAKAINKDSKPQPETVPGGYDVPPPRPVPAEGVLVSAGYNQAIRGY